MNSARLFRPLARAAFRQPAGLVRPSMVARPALIASQSKSQKTTTPSQTMVLARKRYERIEYELTILDHPQVGRHAPARPLLLRQ